MKITKTQLKRLIKEELRSVIKEGWEEESAEFEQIVSTEMAEVEATVGEIESIAGNSFPEQFGRGELGAIEPAKLSAALMDGAKFIVEMENPKALKLLTRYLEALAVGAIHQAETLYKNLSKLVPGVEDRLPRAELGRQPRGGGHPGLTQMVHKDLKPPTRQRLGRRYGD
jgi:hypothetical protein